MIGIVPKGKPVIVISVQKRPKAGINAIGTDRRKNKVYSMTNNETNSRFYKNPNREKSQIQKLE